MSITINRTDEYVDYNVSAPNNRGYLTIDTSSWIDKPWMFYELPALKFEIYTESGGELVKYQNFSREIRTYNPVYSPLGVLNVTIDIRNVPEEFILRIIPIFDNDSISARNMLIENGIENGEIWGKDQDVPTQSFDLDIEFIECSGEYIPPTPPTHEETITGVPPITFDGSTSEPLVSWTILGNGQQTGTPTPDNPVMPTFCGVRTENLFDYTTMAVSTENSYLKPDGTIGTSNDWNISDYIPCNGTSFVLGYIGGNTPAFCLYDENKNYITGKSYNTGGASIKFAVSITSTITAKYIRFSYCKANPPSGDTLSQIMLNSGSSLLPYEPFGWAEKITCAGQTTPVYLGQTQTVRRIKCVDLGTLTYTKTGAGNFRATLGDGKIVGNSEIAPAICSHFKVVSANDYSSMPYSLCTAINNQSIVIINKTGFEEMTAEEFKSAMSGVLLWYALKTEQTGIANEPLAKIGDYADELSRTDTTVSIPTIKGQNTLTVETDLQPSSVTITYIKEGQ